MRSVRPSISRMISHQKRRTRSAVRMNGLKSKRMHFSDMESSANIMLLAAKYASQHPPCPGTVKFLSS